MRYEIEVKEKGSRFWNWVFWIAVIAIFLMAQ
jgi:hypothetical protein